MDFERPVPLLSTPTSISLCFGLVSNIGIHQVDRFQPPKTNLMDSHYHAPVVPHTSLDSVYHLTETQRAAPIDLSFVGPRVQRCFIHLYSLLKGGNPFSWSRFQISSVLAERQRFVM